MPRRSAPTLRDHRHEHPAARSRGVAVVRRSADGATVAEDLVAVEEPLEIRVAETPVAVVMRTPGNDEELARGFLLTEGILVRPGEIAAILLTDESHLEVELSAGVEVDLGQFQRNMFVSSSCGICGKASVEAVRLFARPARPFHVDASVVAKLTGQLREHQPTFDETGGLHAAGLFTLGGVALAVREDVGRHNAVDKVIGAAAATGWPLPPSLLVVSGRQSFEIVQKAAMAGIGGVVGVSAPSSLAVELAEELGMLLVGFARGERMNVYAGADRLDGLEA